MTQVRAPREYDPVDARTVRTGMLAIGIAIAAALVVVTRGDHRRVAGIVSRSDLLAAHAPRLGAAHRTHRARELTSAWWSRDSSSNG